MSLATATHSETDRLYKARVEMPELLEVPELAFLMIDGHGDPNGPEFQDALHALFSIAYTTKFDLKKEGIDYRVPPLEGLWSNFLAASSHAAPRGQWRWTAMIMQPAVVTKRHVDAARIKAQEKRPLTALARVRFERFHEGLCAQVMHMGPYSSEEPTIQLLHAFIKEHGYRLRGQHHEIYLGDPRRAAPAKLKTILRQPVA